MVPDMNETSRLGLAAAVTEDSKSTKPNKAAPEPPRASDGLVTWSLEGNQKEESVKSIIHEDDGIRAIEAVSGQEGKRIRVDLGDFQNGGKYRSIVKIQSRWGDKKTGTWTMGTGWLAREDLVITAAHNVFSATHNCQASRIQCWIGYRGVSITDKSSVQHRNALNVVTTESWLRQRSDRERRDVAIIQVDKPFAGNLRLFKYTNTPTAKREGTIIVVGYPGDKSPKPSDDPDSWMCEARQKANYDHDRSANHMIEYKMDTYGGQSGAPILLSDHNGTVVIGTHCYGGTGGKVNSGSPIGGEYGNNYDDFIKRVELSKKEAPHRLGDFQPKFDHPESQPGSYYSGIRDSGLDDFWDMLRDVDQVGLYPIGEHSALGPVGWLMGTVAGGMIGILSASAENTGQAGFIFPSKRDPVMACIYRAQLAESAFQCVLQLAPSRERTRIMFNMQKFWIDHPSWLPFDTLGEEHLQAQLRPIFNDFGFRLAVSQWQKGVNANPRVKPLGKELLKLTDLGPIDLSRRGDPLLRTLFSGQTRFVHSADEVTVESRGLWLSELLRTAVRVAKPIVSEPASYGLRRIVKAMGVGHKDSALMPSPNRIDSEMGRILGRAVGAEVAMEAGHKDSALMPSPDRIDSEMGRILRRAVVADTALQVLEDMQLWELQALSVVPRGTERESALDKLKTIVQEMGQRTTDIAEESIVKHFGPIHMRLQRQTHHNGRNAVPASAVADLDELPGELNENGNKPPAHYSPTAVPESKDV
ncbi:hypothetical protein MY11210_006787 [Beauveria gryllotalpidicola]